MTPPVDKGVICVAPSAPPVMLFIATHWCPRQLRKAKGEIIARAAGIESYQLLS